MRQVLAGIEGTYGLLVIDADQPDRIVVARRGSPIVIGIGDREMLVASDIAALVRSTRQVVALADGEMAVLNADGYRTFALEGTPTQQRPFTVDWDPSDFTLDGHPHFMHKEIAEQPAAISRALLGPHRRARIRHRQARRHRPRRAHRARHPPRRAARLRHRLLRRHGRRAADRGHLAHPGHGRAGRRVRLPQPGDRARRAVHRAQPVGRDRRHARGGAGDQAPRRPRDRARQRRRLDASRASATASTCTPAPRSRSPRPRRSPRCWSALSLLALHLGRVRDLGPGRRRRTSIDGLRALPDAIESIIARRGRRSQAIAERYATAASLFFIGRHRGYPIALEGAQKLKEISYIHAEAYPASELKHGPLALIAPDFPSVVLVPDDDLVEKNISTIHQIRARSGPVIGVVQDRGAAANDASIAAGEPLLDDVIRIPTCAPELAPILLTIPLQLLAYHAAISLGRDVDQPRNLAKSVTVA